MQLLQSESTVADSPPASCKSSQQRQKYTPLNPKVSKKIDNGHSFKSNQKYNGMCNRNDCFNISASNSHV